MSRNAAGGFGITIKVLEELDSLPVHVWTTGNHVWDKKEGVPLLDAHPTLLRPANYPDGNPGRGWCVEETASGVPVAVINLQGQAMMPPIDNAFRCADEVLEEIRAAHPAGAGDSGRHACRGDVGEAGHGLVPRRSGDGGARHTHPRPDRR